MNLSDYKLLIINTYITGIIGIEIFLSQIIKLDNPRIGACTRTGKISQLQYIIAILIRRYVILLQKWTKIILCYFEH